jgi:hypothetical protein
MLLWMSQPGARHSRNIAVRGEIAIVIFDSTASPHQRNGVYVEATAAIVPDTELEHAVAPWRLYRARASAVYVLENEHDRRVAVELAP